MLPRDYFELVEGWEAHEEREHIKNAWLAATIINGVGMRKNPVKLDDLLPKKKSNQNKSGAELKADLDVLKKRSRPKPSKPKAAAK